MALTAWVLLVPAGSTWFLIGSYWFHLVPTASVWSNRFLRDLVSAGSRESDMFVVFFRPSVGEVLSWAESLEALLTNQCKAFHFLFVFKQFSVGVGAYMITVCFCWLNSLPALLSLVRWSGSVPSLSEVRVQRGESGLLVGCGEFQENTPSKQDGGQS